ncbi:MAG TPA: ABC transporter permease [Spirochaetia bacterium]|nr:ABC transporter permease [Spirochaetia bacterium]
MHGRGDQESYYVASQWRLMGRRFRRHKLAMIGTVMLVILYLLGLFCEFFAPYGPYERHAAFLFCPPQRVHLVGPEGRLTLRPFLYGLDRKVNLDTMRKTYVEDPATTYPLRFFAKGTPYLLFGFIPASRHFVTAGTGPLFLFGTDDLGRDMLSRVLYAARISLSIGLVGVFLSFVLGCLIGGISGFYGRTTDMVIQRIIDFLISLPTIPLWMALSAALPPKWPSIKVYFGITIILAFLGWCGLARVVRGKILELREEDFVMAARISGAGEPFIIVRHLLPSFISYLIVNLTLAIPSMILGETALSFLGLGLRPPVVSWGVLLQQAQNIRTIAGQPWLLIPALFVIATVLAFNFLGDGLRDAADPYK